MGGSMKEPAIAFLIKFKSSLPLDEVMKIVEERAPEFEALEGLLQKYYVHDPESGEIGGLYVWDSPDALADYRSSELRSTIAQAYHTEGEPSIQVYRVLKTLRDGPASG
jgi:hypothetical protein